MSRLQSGVPSLFLRVQMTLSYSQQQQQKRRVKNAAPRVFETGGRGARRPLLLLYVLRAFTEEDTHRIANPDPCP